MSNVVQHLQAFNISREWQNLLLAYAQTVKQDYTDFCQAYDAGLLIGPVTSVTN